MDHDVLPGHGPPSKQYGTLSSPRHSPLAVLPCTFLLAAPTVLAAARFAPPTLLPRLRAPPPCDPAASLSLNPAPAAVPSSGAQACCPPTPAPPSCWPPPCSPWAWRSSSCAGPSCSPATRGWGRSQLAVGWVSGGGARQRAIAVWYNALDCCTMHSFTCAPAFIAAARWQPMTPSLTYWVVRPAAQLMRSCCLAGCDGRVVRVVGFLGQRKVAAAHGCSGPPTFPPAPPHLACEALLVVLVCARPPQRPDAGCRV